MKVTTLQEQSDIDKSKIYPIVRLMHDFVRLPLDPIMFLKYVVVALFGFIILISFIYGTIPSWVIYRPRRKRAQQYINPKHTVSNELYKEPTKIIGGLGVFIIAILANNPYIYCVSLFIGGLLIASEKFMIHLAAIFNSDKDKVSEISKLWIDELKNDEITQKQNSEAAEVLSAHDKAMKDDKITNQKGDKKQPVAKPRSYEDILKKVRKIEAAALKKIESRLMTQSTVLKPYVRVSIENHSYQFDAVGQDIISKSVMFGLEVKYYSYLHLRSIERLVERIKPFTEVSPFPVLLIVVYENIQTDLLKQIQESSLSDRSDSRKLGIVYFQNQKDDTLKIINDSRLTELLPSEFTPF